VQRRSSWQAAADELARARSGGEITDEQWFGGMRAIFDAAYLAADNPRAQSGFGGDEARWQAARRPIVRAIDRDGRLLDIGCANGYLMECLPRWTSHRIEPYGLELAPAVAELARRRLPQWAERIYVGNALTWQPPFRFDFVRTELVYVPEERQQAFTERLLADVVAPGGGLIVCGYGSPRSGLAAYPVQRIVRSLGFTPALEFDAEAPEGGGPIIEVAVLRSTSVSRRCS
jgi:SAM-dependent methyltransferase